MGPVDCVSAISCVEMRWFLVKIPHFSYLLITFTLFGSSVSSCVNFRISSISFEFFVFCFIVFFGLLDFFCLYLVVFGFFGFLVLLFWSSLRFSFGFHSVSIRIPFGFHSVYIHSVSIRIPFGLLSVYIGFFTRFYLWRSVLRFYSAPSHCDLGELCFFTTTNIFINSLIRDDQSVQKKCVGLWGSLRSSGLRLV
jgi:hypothetical protein